MNSIGIIASIIAAITGIAGMIIGIITLRNSKGNVIKRIERKEQQIYEIEQQFTKEYGLFADIRRHPSSFIIEQLQNQINELKKRI